MRLLAEGHRLRKTGEQQDAQCTTLVEAMAIPEKLESRIDWAFEFSCGAETKTDDKNVQGGKGSDESAKVSTDEKTPFGLLDGDARIIIGVSAAGGDVHVTRFGRYVKVPDVWLRARKNADTMNSLIATVTQFAMYMCFLAAAGKGNSSIDI